MDEETFKQLVAEFAELRRTVLAIVAQRDALLEDATRYRWLRAQYWSESSMCIVVNPKTNLKPGSYCPYGHLLDMAVDEAMEKCDGR